MKQIKTLGVLAIAAMAFTAFIGVSSASAFEKFTTGKEGAKILETTLEQHVFTVTDETVECDNITFAGTTGPSGSISQMVTPTYQSCETGSGFTATVTNEGCTYTFTPGKGEGGTAGDVHVEPTSGSSCRFKIVVAVPFIANCEITVKNQTLTDVLTYTNVKDAGGNPVDIKVKVDATNVHAEVDKSTGACPLTVGTHTDASYTGESTVQAEGTWIQVS